MAAKTEKKGGIRKWFKELFSELRKVTWPNFKTVVKNTGIVLAVVGIFLVIVWAFDAGLSALYRLLIDAITA